VSSSMSFPAAGLEELGKDGGAVGIVRVGGGGGQGQGCAGGGVSRPDSQGAELLQKEKEGKTKRGRSREDVILARPCGRIGL